jgi:hypothetical protein
VKIGTREAVTAKPYDVLEIVNTFVKSVYCITMQPTQSHSCSYSYPCTYVTILRKNQTNALYMLTPVYSHCYTYTYLALQGPSLGTSGTFCEQGQQNTYPDVSIRLKSNVL